MKPDERARRLYQDSFGAEPAAVASAPGRVNLIGEHVDYHGGQVLPMATPQRTAVAVGKGGGRLRAVSEQDQVIDGAWPPVRRNDWSDYVAGVASQWPLPAWGEGGLAVAVASDLPVGAGLSSSAALEVATARALAGWSGAAADPRTLADLAWRAETAFVGVPCGRMDQLAAALADPGGALLINCRTFEAREVRVGCAIVLVDSGESHALRDSGYAVRRREGDEAMAALKASFPSLEYLTDLPPARLPSALELLTPVLGKRVRHVVNENQRTLLAARALDQDDLRTFGTLVNQSHDSLRDLYECSTPGIDAMVKAARGTAGVLGARLVGAGWGGAVLVAAEPGAGAEVARALKGRVVLG